MKKTLVYGAATAVVALSLGSCWAATNRVEAVYGPPPIEEDDAEKPGTDAEEVDEPSGTMSFTGTDEPVEDVYGPPVDVEDDQGEDVIDVEVTDVDVVTPVLYGPPPDMD